MKIKQKLTTVTEAEIDVEFPVYTQRIGDGEYLYVVTERYELQHPHVPTLLVTTITENDSGFELSEGQALSIDSDLARDRITEAKWNSVVKEFSDWTRQWLRKMRAGCRVIAGSDATIEELRDMLESANFGPMESDVVRKALVEFDQRQSCERRLAEACERLRRGAALLAAHGDTSMATWMDQHSRRLLGVIRPWSELE